MARNLAARARVIVDAPEVIAVRHRRESAVERKNLESVARQIEFANDLRSQQRDDIRTNREFKTGKHLFSDRRAAEHVPSLEHKNFLSGAREIRRVHQTIMTAPDYDDV